MMKPVLEISYFVPVNNLLQGSYDVEIALVCSYSWINTEQHFHWPKSSKKAQAGSKHLL